jgi:hypothetical protein
MNLLKNKKFKTEVSLLSSCIFAVSYVVEENFAKILENATKIEGKVEGLTVLEENSKMVVKIGNTKMTPDGLVVEVEDTMDITNQEFLKDKFFEILKDIFIVSPPNQKYFSLKFKEILRKDFTF